MWIFCTTYIPLALFTANLTRTLRYPAKKMTKLGSATRVFPPFPEIGLLPILVGGLNPSEKYDSQLGSLFPIYGKLKFMFQTTNQIKFAIPTNQKTTFSNHLDPWLGVILHHPSHRGIPKCNQLGMVCCSYPIIIHYFPTTIIPLEVYGIAI